MITREQVKDLQPGDVVQIREEDYRDVVTRGPLHEASSGALDLGGIYRVRAADGSACLASRYALTVVSRAPRPLYVNHPRTEPVPGDVVRDADDEGRLTWRWCLPGLWVDSAGEQTSRQQLPTRHRLRLLVDGETGQAVPS